MDHWRHVPQERLLCLPRQPSLRRIREARIERSEPSDCSWYTDAHDRLCEHEHYRLRADKFKCRAAQRIATHRRLVNMRHERLSYIHSLRTLAILVRTDDDDYTMNERAFICNIVFASGLAHCFGIAHALVLRLT